MSLVRTYFLHGLIVSLLIGGLFAFLGVYNTNTLPLFERFVFWVSTMLVGNLSTGILIPLVFDRWLPSQPVAVKLCCIILLISAPITLVLAGFDHTHSSDWPIYIWLRNYLYVTVISAILIVVGYFILRPRLMLNKQPAPLSDSTADEVAQSQQLARQFLKRLALKHHQAELRAIKSEDHYLRVYTSVGEELILMRLSDAIKALEGVDGMQTHRSWWVARGAITDLQRRQGKLLLSTALAVDVPVSRTYEKLVKQRLTG